MLLLLLLVMIMMVVVVVVILFPPPSLPSSPSCSCYIVAGGLMEQDEEGFSSLCQGEVDCAQAAQHVWAFAKVGGYAAQCVSACTMRVSLRAMSCVSCVSCLVCHALCAMPVAHACGPCNVTHLPLPHCTPSFPPSPANVDMLLMSNTHSLLLPLTPHPTHPPTHSQDMLLMSKLVLMPHNQQPVTIRVGLHTGGR